MRWLLLAVWIGRCYATAIQQNAADGPHLRLIKLS